jgi:hypothetical protein
MSGRVFAGISRVRLRRVIDLMARKISIEILRDLFAIGALCSLCR